MSVRNGPPRTTNTERSGRTPPELNDSSATLDTSRLESASDGILTVHRAGNVVTFNRRFLDLWRIPNDLAGRADNATLISFVLDQLVDPGTFLRIVRENQASPDREYFSLLRFKDGRVLERFSRARWVRGEIVGRVLTFRDVTERERLLEAASDGLRTREEFFALTNHIVPPIRPPSPIAQGLREADLSAGQGAGASEGSIGPQHLLGLRLDVEQVDLVQIVREVVRQHAAELVRSGFALSMHGDRPVLGWWNRRALEQLVSEVVLTTIMLGSGKAIEVRIDQNHAGGLLTVHNSAIGAHAKIPRVIPGAIGWEPTNPGGGGVTLGLQAIGSLVDSLQGTFRFEGQRDHGTRLEITLPRTSGDPRK